MNILKHAFHKLGRHAAEHALRTALVEDFVVATRLHDGHVVLQFILAYFTADAHTLRKEFHKVVVDFIDVAAQGFKAFRRGGKLADYEF